MKKSPLLAAIILSLAVSSVHARDQLMFGFEYVNGNPPYSSWVDPLYDCGTPLCPIDVLVYVRSEAGLRTIRFAAPLPDCFDNPAAVTFDTPYSIVEGDLASGMTIDFGGCLASDVVVYPNGDKTIYNDIYVGTIHLVLFLQGGCCSYAPYPDPDAASRRIEGTDCDGDLVLVSHLGCTINLVVDGVCGRTSVPYGEYPESGSDVPAGRVSLDWDCAPLAGTNIGVFIQTLQMGTDPNSLQTIAHPYEQPYQTGPLAPGTYYWRVLTSVDFGHVTGPTWSFNVIAPVAAETRTIGGVKALFRGKK